MVSEAKLLTKSLNRPTIIIFGLLTFQLNFENLSAHTTEPSNRRSVMNPVETLARCDQALNALKHSQDRLEVTSALTVAQLLRILLDTPLQALPKKLSEIDPSTEDYLLAAEFFVNNHLNSEGPLTEGEREEAFRLRTSLMNEGPYKNAIDSRFQEPVEILVERLDWTPLGSALRKAAIEKLLKSPDLAKIEDKIAKIFPEMATDFRVSESLSAIEARLEWLPKGQSRAIALLKIRDKVHDYRTKLKIISGELEDELYELDLKLSGPKPESQSKAIRERIALNFLEPAAQSVDSLNIAIEDIAKLDQTELQKKAEQLLSEIRIRAKAEGAQEQEYLAAALDDFQGRLRSDRHLARLLLSVSLGFKAQSPGRAEWELAYQKYEIEKISLWLDHMEADLVEKTRQHFEEQEQKESSEKPHKTSKPTRN